jgi:hypothetical protein
MIRPNLGFGLLLATLLCKRCLVVAAAEPIQVRVTDARIQHGVPQSVTVVGPQSEIESIRKGQVLYVKVEPRDVDSAKSGAQRTSQ